LDIAVWNRENQAGNSAGGVGVAKQHAAPRLKTHSEGRFRRLAKTGAGSNIQLAKDRKQTVAIRNLLLLFFVL
jgi:hypothetical protein